jgi:hypothetical protein
MSGIVEFTDKDRSKIQELFYDYLDAKQNNTLSANTYYIEYLISLDKHFFDPYVELHDIFLHKGEIRKSHKILSVGYQRLMKEVFIDNKYPDSMEYLDIKNRHIFRLLSQYAQSLWLFDLKASALDILLILLKLDKRDALGSRYLIVGILEGSDNSYDLENSCKDLNVWFLKTVKKYYRKHPILRGYEK